MTVRPNAPAPISDRLRYRRVRLADVARFHQLVRDPHVRRYLLDGHEMPRAWCVSEIRRSDRLFESRGVGLWLVHAREGLASKDAGGRAVGRPVRADRQALGFCGFRVFEELSDEPQLIYAFPHHHTGQGFATEVARCLVGYACDQSHFDSVLAAVDEPNRASIRVLEKVGFSPAGRVAGPFGSTLLFRGGLAPQPTSANTETSPRT